MSRKMDEAIDFQGWSMESWSEKGKRLFHVVILQWGLLYICIGFLLGRAVMVGDLSPFAVPFFAVLYHLRRDRLALGALAVVAGAASQMMTIPWAMIGAMLLFIIIQKCFEKWGKGALSYTPFAVGAALLLGNLSVHILVEFNTYVAMMSVVESGLGMILTFIFVHSLPLLAGGRRTQPLKNEEIVCLVILLGSVMTGTIGWTLAGMSIEYVLARYGVLIFAMAAGGAIGATVGVVTGIILSLANPNAVVELSLLAFSGLLGGLLKEGKKIGVACGLVVGTVLLGLYVQEGQIGTMVLESLVAILLFLLTPTSFIMAISKYIPGTDAHHQAQHHYMKRVQGITAHKVTKFSRLFEQLSKSFSASTTYEEDREERTDLLLSNVTEQTCQSCFKKKICWQKKLDETYALMDQIVEAEENNQPLSEKQRREWVRHCVKADKVIECISQVYDQYRTRQLYKQKMSESRQLVADQLSGVSEVMNTFAREIEREEEQHQELEEQVLDTLEGIGLAIQEIDIVSLEEGNVQIVLSQPVYRGMDECEKIIAPALSDILNETIIVADTSPAYDPNGYMHVRFCSARAFTIQTGCASAAKGGGWVNGDNYTTLELGQGKYALAIADGMGNGQRAFLESSDTLQLLQQILQSGIEETVAIKSINSILSLRSVEEMFSTLDLAMIDLQNGNTKFLKIGSSPSFIKRANTCIRVSASNLPIGIIDEIDVDVVSKSLKAGDLLIMMTDGIYDAPHFIENKERWMRRMIDEIETNNPQEVADLLLEKVIRHHHGNVMDDMTVLVARINHNVPRWSTISVSNIPKLNRRKQSPLSALAESIET